MALVKRIRQLLKKNEYWVIRHDLKKTNHVADRIAKMVQIDLEGINVLPKAPTYITEDLDNDQSKGFSTWSV